MNNRNTKPYSKDHLSERGNIDKMEVVVPKDRKNTVSFFYYLSSVVRFLPYWL